MKDGCLQDSKDYPGGKPSETMAKAFAEHFEKAVEVCSAVGLIEAKKHVRLISGHLKFDGMDSDHSSYAADFRNAYGAMMSDLWSRKFVQVDSVYTDYLDNEALFGTAVNDAFPSAKDDIKSAGNCLAFENGTAAVFHLMRAVEWSLRGLCKHFGIIRIPRSKKPSIRKKYIPLEYSQWEKMLEELQEGVDKKIDKMAAGKRKREMQQFYYPLLQDIKGFKDAFRNHTMHSRDATTKYNQDEAKAVFTYVQRFLMVLATRVSE